METIRTKPHHILDIIKLFGKEVNHFVPDLKYGHNFYSVGNLILSNPNIFIEIVLGADDICRPCKFNLKGKCSDKVKDNPPDLQSKNDWNTIVDTRLLEILGIQEGQVMSAVDFCKLALKKLTSAEISQIWEERPKQETIQRIEYLINGLRKYIY